jgi:hypothetical protein
VRTECWRVQIIPSQASSTTFAPVVVLVTYVGATSFEPASRAPNRTLASLASTFARVIVISRHRLARHSSNLPVLVQIIPSRTPCARHSSNLPVLVQIIPSRTPCARTSSNPPVRIKIIPSRGTSSNIAPVIVFSAYVGASFVKPASVSPNHTLTMPFVNFRAHHRLRHISWRIIRQTYQYASKSYPYYALRTSFHRTSSDATPEGSCASLS